MKLLLLKEVADMLRLEERLLYRPKARERMQLPAVKIGGRLRFRAEDVERLIAEGRENFENIGEPAHD